MLLPINPFKIMKMGEAEVGRFASLRGCLVECIKIMLNRVYLLRAPMHVPLRPHGLCLQDNNIRH
uniref:Putative ovule protein n=1 Tax=Solanum chacoense TaxID=4108 RepID=A0A0V0HJA8_SOLCH